MLKISKKADYALMALQHIASVQFGDVTPGRVVNTKEIAEEYQRAFHQIAVRGEQVLKQDRVADHHRSAEDRQIEGQRAAISSAQSSKHSVARNQEPDA